MTDILIFLNELINNKAILILFCFTNLVMVCGFFVYVVISITRKGFSLLKRQTFLLLGLSMITFDAFAYTNGLIVKSVLQTLSISLFLDIPLLIIKVKSGNTKSESIEQQKGIELAKHFEEIKRQSDEEENGEPLTSNAKSLIGRSVEKLKTEQGFREYPVPEIDFSHVKNILKRMPNFSLSVADKKQVKELERSILKAEKGEIDGETKGKLNDGLGSLLKIMSKYGV